MTSVVSMMSSLPMKSSTWFFKNDKKKQCASLKKKSLWEEFLGSLAYEPEHGS